MRRGLDPKWMQAKYAGTCKRCGKAIKAGERMFYFPNARACYCSADGCGGKESRAFESAAFDEMNCVL